MLENLYILFAFISIFILINIAAFAIIMERKLLALIHKRVGPSIQGFRGILQTFADLLKSFNKELYFTIRNVIYILGLCLVIMILAEFYISELFILGLSTLYYADGELLFLIQFAFENILGLTSFGISLICSTMYSDIAASRIILCDCFAETNDVTISFITSSFCGFFDYDNQFINVNEFFIFIFGCLVISSFLDLFTVAQRSPVDLIETEGELVAGYNLEYSGGYLLIIYFSEYVHLLIGCFFFLSNLFILTFLINIQLFWIFLNIYLNFILIDYCSLSYNILFNILFNIIYE